MNVVLAQLGTGEALFNTPFLSPFLPLLESLTLSPLLTSEEDGKWYSLEN